MDKLYEIIIDGVSIDLFDPNDLDLAITSAVSDANNLTIRKASNTKIIKVPASGPNKILFGHPDDINSVVSINQLTKPTAIILADGTQIFKGYAKISGSLELNNISEYEITCIGANGDWIGRIGGSKLSDLDYSDQNHTNNYATIIASETVAVGREYVYDLIDRGNFYKAFGDTTPAVSILNRHPAISMVSLVKRIFESIGYVVVSNFIDNSFFTKLYWVFVNEKLSHPSTFNVKCLSTATRTTDQTTSATVDTIVQFNSITSDPLSSPASGSTISTMGSTMFFYICRGSGSYRFKWSLSLPIVANYSFYIRKRNAYTGATPVNIYAVSTGVMAGAYVIDQTFPLVYGDEITLFVINNSVTISTGATFECVEAVGVLGMGENQSVDMNQNLPGTLQLDFLQGLKELFNLHFNPNTDTRRIIIEPYDDFYSLTPEDWSNKLDKSRDIQVLFTGSNLSKKISYRYKSDSNDKFVENWQKQTGKFLGSEEATITNVFAKDETLKIENKIFAATWMDKAVQIGLATTLIPRMWSETSLPPIQTTSFLPRILYYDGVKALPAGETWRFNAINRTDYPRFFSYDDSAVNNNSLFFEDRTYSSGLFQKYFRNAQNSINDGRNFIAYINIRDIDISNLDHQKPKYIEDQGNGAYFILDKVDNYKSQDNVTTKCVFVKVMSSSQIKKLPYVDGLVVSNSVAGQSGLITLSNSGTEILVGSQVVLVQDSNGSWIPSTNYVGYI